MRQMCTLLLLTLLTFSSPGRGHPGQANKLSPRLRQLTSSARDNDELLVWIYFTDKGRHQHTPYHAALESLTPRCRQRRLKVRTQEDLVDRADFPVEEDYVITVRHHVQRLRHTSKWLNAVSAQATKRQIDLIQTFGFVKLIDLVVRSGHRRPEPVQEPALNGSTGAAGAAAQGEAPFDYGPSLPQLSQIDVPAVHSLGDFGQGVLIGVFDTGFNLDHEAFQMLNVIAAHDFVNGDDDVSDGRDLGRGHHGTQVLSVIGGFAEGQLIGPAFAADYILAKTENTESETPREEDNWVAALEWAEGLGVDVVSSSVGYLDFDRPFDDHTWQDMDGRTLAISRAAAMAVERGVVVVNAAGNSGKNPLHNTLLAPADGDGVISVGAMRLDGRRAGFSSVGPTVDGRIKPDVMALGVNVRLVNPRSSRKYQSGSGTSFACPLVAGTVGLILSAHPDWSPAQVLDALRRTASNPAAPNNLIGWGIVDALAAVQFSDKRLSSR